MCKLIQPRDFFYNRVTLINIINCYSWPQKCKLCLQFIKTPQLVSETVSKISNNIIKKSHLKMTLCMTKFILRLRLF